jgi:4-hydroxy-tetrahydrodipicolinate reductase
MSVRIGILGSQGRMGKIVADLVRTEFSAQASLHDEADRGSKLEDLLTADVVIDFSLPEAMSELVKIARAAAAKGQSLPAFVIASTGWKIDDRRELEELAKLTPCLMSSNFSTGVMVLLEVLRNASPFLEKLGYTPVITEAHHKHKKDSPSGTAISLQRAIAPAGPGNVQTLSVRAGEVIGDHEATFYGVADKLVFGHFAQDRSIFARGAIQVALWLAKKPRGQQKGLLGIDTYFQELKNV